MNKSEYQEYLASREWAEKKKAIRERSGNVCERCHVEEVSATHHLTYENVGNESLEELMGVCQPCHDFLSGLSDDDPAVGSYRLSYRIDGAIEAIKFILKGVEDTFNRKYPGSKDRVKDHVATVNRDLQLILSELPEFPDPKMHKDHPSWNTSRSETGKSTSTIHTADHPGSRSIGAS